MSTAQEEARYQQRVKSRERWMTVGVCIVGATVVLGPLAHPGVATVGLMWFAGCAAIFYGFSR